MLRARFRDCAVMARRLIADAEIERLQVTVAALDSLPVKDFSAAIPA